MKRTEHDRKVRIFELLNRLGVPANLVGREYLETGVLMMMQDQTTIYMITKRLYPAIAKQYGSTDSSVFHSISRAIETAWNRGATDEQEQCFGYTVSSQKGKPTNSEFMTMVARRLLLEEEENTR